MQPLDKFGNPIYPRTFHELQRIGAILESIGFSEAGEKPNLFYRTSDREVVFADMRGTKEVPIWDEPMPLVYVKLRDGAENWERVRKENEIEKEFSNSKIPYRHSFYHNGEVDYELQEKLVSLHNNTFFDADFMFFFDDYDKLPDGYCQACGMDVKKDLYFCSLECKGREKQRIMIKVRKQPYGKLIDERVVALANEPRVCEICGKQETLSTNLDDMTSEQFITSGIEKLKISGRFHRHHVSRIPEKLMILCPSCHIQVEQGKIRPDLKPEMPRKKAEDTKRRYRQEELRKKREQRDAESERERMATIEKERVARKRRNRIWRDRMYGGLWRK